MAKANRIREPRRTAPAGGGLGWVVDALARLEVDANTERRKARTHREAAYHRGRRAAYHNAGAMVLSAMRTLEELES